MNVNYILTARDDIGAFPDIQHALLDALTPKEAEADVVRIVRVLSPVGYTRFTMWEIREDNVWNGIVHYDIAAPSDIPVTVEYF